MIKKEELIIGNILNYTTAENDLLPTTIDWQDLKWISADTEGFNLVHYGIRLTEENIEKIGFNVIQEGWLGLNSFTWNVYDRVLRYNGECLREIKYIHNLQNIYLDLTEKELEINQ